MHWKSLILVNKGIKVERNLIRDEGAKYIAEMLKCNYSLVKLDLGNIVWLV